MNSRAINLIMLCVVMLFFVFPASVSAATEKTCDCYCGSSAGVVDQNQKVTSTKCQNICGGQKLKVAAFACGANQYPERNIKCFTKDQCDQQKGEFNSAQPPECVSGSHYCYPSDVSKIQTKLQVKIGGLDTVGDIGVYMEVAYKWLVGTATLFAIVFIMIGGFQWTFGGLSAEQMGNAKKRMMNGVIGLILLLSSYLILFTVNPQLVKLEAPKLPMMRTIGLADVNNCESLLREGYTLDGIKEADGLMMNTVGDKECGDTAKVLKTPSGKELPDGTVCNYSYCAEDSEICVPGDTPQCMRCEELVSNSSVVEPTPELCSMFNSLYVSNGESKMEEKDGDIVVSKMSYCFFSRDDDVGGELLGRGSCAKVEVDCGAVTSCGGYDLIPVEWGGAAVTLDEIDLGKNSGLPGTDYGYGKALYENGGELTLGSFCEGGSAFHDICGWNRQDDLCSCYLGGWSLIPYGDILSSIAPSTYNCISSGNCTSSLSEEETEAVLEEMESYEPSSYGP